MTEEVVARHENEETQQGANKIQADRQSRDIPSFNLLADQALVNIQALSKAADVYTFKFARKRDDLYPVRSKYR